MLPSLIKATQALVKDRYTLINWSSWMLIVTTKTKDGTEAKRNHCTDDFKDHISSLTSCIYLVVRTVFMAESQCKSAIVILDPLSFFLFLPSFLFLFCRKFIRECFQYLYEKGSKWVGSREKLSPAAGPTRPQSDPGSCETSCNILACYGCWIQAAWGTEPDLVRGSSLRPRATSRGWLADSILPCGEASPPALKVASGQLSTASSTQF